MNVFLVQKKVCLKAALLLIATTLLGNMAHAADWPSSPQLSGNAFLSPGLVALQNDATNSPVAVWLDKGTALWSASTGSSCQSCHGPISTMQKSASSFPRLSPDGKSLINLDDQIINCRKRSGYTQDKLEDEDVLALSAVLHQAAMGQTINLQPPEGHKEQWQTRLNQGAKMYTARLGRINLACVHCHDQGVGRQMRSDVISPGNPTGFPIYRMSWQRLGSIDRRLRACYSGVQAVLPPAGDPVLRDLELYLKVRANGMLLDGPSIRR